MENKQSMQQTIISDLNNTSGSQELQFYEPYNR
jgi:hypothetical protein